MEEKNYVRLGNCVHSDDSNDLLFRHAKMLEEHPKK